MCIRDRGTATAGVQAEDRMPDLVALRWRGVQVVQGQEGVDPLHRPGAVAFRFEELQRAEGQVIVVGRHREVQTAAALGLGADGGGERVHRHALVEGLSLIHI